MEKSIKPELCPRCGSEIWLVEYPIIDPNHYDGTSEYACKNALKIDDKEPTCTWRIGRFCGKPLAPNESEPKYCHGIHPVHA